MTRYRRLGWVAAAILAVACSADTSTGPTRPVRIAGSRSVTGPNERNGVQIGQGRGTYIACIPRTPSYGAAIIGPQGGDLIIGPHRLIVPPGALTERVWISGVVPAGQTFRIDLAPHGLTFRRPAGLILDASSCADVPPIAYLIDEVTPSDPIPAFFSNWWHTIAAPIWHFSGYAIAMRTGCSGTGSGGGGGADLNATRDMTSDSDGDGQPDCDVNATAR